MKLTKMGMSSLACASLLGVSLSANADNLNVSNATKYDLSFAIQDSCSQEFGTVKSRTMKVIPDADFNKACSYKPEACEAKVYDRANCTGEQIATIEFNTKFGVQKIEARSIGVVGSGFNLFFEDIRQRSN